MKRALLLPALLLVTSLSCVTSPTKPDSIYGAVVDCAKVNPQASAALAAVETCLVGAMAQNYAVCLTGLVTSGHFVIDEVACVVAWYAQQQNGKVAASTATLADLEARSRANAWLANEAIMIRNTYSQAK
jgi:hypothetical protein